MTLADAMSAPRLHHQALPDSLYVERDALRPEVADSLRAMGYGVSSGRGIGLVNAIMRVRREAKERTEIGATDTERLSRQPN